MVDVVRVPPESWIQGGRSGPAAAMERVRSACADTDHQDPLDEAALLRLRHHGLEGSALWLVADSAFALAQGGALDLAVAPATRGCGFGRALLEQVLAELPGPLDAWSHGDHPGAAALAAGFGFTRARELWVMHRDGGLALPDQEPGVELRTYRDTDRDELLRVNAAAFADHPEQGAMDAAHLAERMAEPWFDPTGLFLAVEGERVLGFHWTKVHRSGVGEVYVVGIDPAAQGKGLGRTLTLAGLHHLARRGVPSVQLYVESDNAPAIAVYSRLDFTHAPADTHVRYHRA
jgi:mycothiol synthase